MPDLDFGESFQGERAGPAAGAGDGAGDNADVTRDDTDLSDDDGGAVDQSADLPDDGGDAADEGADLPDDGGGAADEGADLPDDDGGLTDLAAALVGTWQAESAVVNGQVLAVAVVGGYDGSVDSVTIEIRADGTLTGYAYAGSDLVMTESGTWSASNTSATIGWSSYQVAWDSVVSDDEAHGQEASVDAQAQGGLIVAVSETQVPALCQPLLKADCELALAVVCLSHVV